MLQSDAPTGFGRLTGNPEVIRRTACKVSFSVNFPSPESQGPGKLPQFPFCGSFNLALQSCEMWQENLAFRSALSPEAVLATLARTTDEEGMTPFSLSGFKGKQAFLSKVDGNKFRLRKRIFYRNSFARHLSALLAPDLGGTRIEAHFAMSFFVRGFMIMWFGFLALFEISAIITTARALLTSGRHLSTDECMLLVVPTAMLIFGWLLVSFGLRLSRKAEGEMIEFVEHTLAARRLPDEP